MKTSTGFGAAGATVEDVRLMKEAVAGRAKVKASGGIRDWKTTLAMLEAGADRIGTSASLAIMVSGNSSGNPPHSDLDQMRANIARARTGDGDVTVRLQIDSRAANLVRRKFLILFHPTSPFTMPIGVCAFWKRLFAVGPPI